MSDEDAHWNPCWSHLGDDCKASGAQTSRRTIPCVQMPICRKLLAHRNSWPQQAFKELVEKKGRNVGLEETSCVFLECGWWKPNIRWPRGVTPVTYIILLILPFTSWKDLTWCILVPYMLPSQLCPFLAWALTRWSDTFPIDNLPPFHSEFLPLLAKWMILLLDLFSVSQNPVLRII